MEGLYIYTQVILYNMIINGFASNGTIDFLAPGAEAPAERETCTESVW